MRFRLHKWYFDCVTASGEAAIVYSARLRWGLLDLGYSAVIHADQGAPASQVQVWRSIAPRIQGSVLHWKDPVLGAQGSWEGIAAGPEVPLLEGLRWRCHQPGGPAWLRLPAGRELRGLGYAEELLLELPPWRLPFAELRWGRFIPDGGGPALAWIQWCGGLDRGWCFQDGRDLRLDGSSEDAVAYDGGRLRLEHAGALREGFLLREILGTGAVLCPGPLRRAHEAKALARGRQEDREGSREGWVIHERVRLR